MQFPLYDRQTNTHLHRSIIYSTKVRIDLYHITTATWTPIVCVVCGISKCVSFTRILKFLQQWDVPRVRRKKKEMIGEVMSHYLIT